MANQNQLHVVTAHLPEWVRQEAKYPTVVVQVLVDTMVVPVLSTSLLVVFVVDEVEALP